MGNKVADEAKRSAPEDSGYLGCSPDAIYQACIQEADQSFVNGVGYIKICIATYMVVVTAISFFMQRAQGDNLTFAGALMGCILINAAISITYLSSFALERIHRRYLVARYTQRKLEDLFALEASSKFKSVKYKKLGLDKLFIQLDRSREISQTDSARCGNVFLLVCLIAAFCGDSLWLFFSFRQLIPNIEGFWRYFWYGMIWASLIVGVIAALWIYVHQLRRSISHSIKDQGLSQDVMLTRSSATSGGHTLHKYIVRKAVVKGDPGSFWVWLPITHILMVAYLLVVLFKGSIELGPKQVTGRSIINITSSQEQPPKSKAALTSSVSVKQNARGKVKPRGKADRR